MSVPAVSVLIAAHNAEATVFETLESLTAQTRPDWEAVAVDDGSTDATLEILKRFGSQDSRIRVISQRNSGAAAARNRAAAESRGVWLAPLDADDLLAPNALEVLLQYEEEAPGFDIYGCSALLLEPDGETVPWSELAELQAPKSFGLLDFVDANRIVFALIRREAFKRVGGYRNVYVEDYDLWLRLLESGAREVSVPNRLFTYRVSQSSKNANRSVSTAATAEMMRQLADRVSDQPEVRGRALARADQLSRVSVRAALEEAIVAEDYSAIPSRYIAARRSFRSQLKWLLGLPVAMLFPDRFARRMSQRLPASRNVWGSP